MGQVREPEPLKSEKLFDDAVNRAGGINWGKGWGGGGLEKREEWSKDLCYKCVKHDAPPSGSKMSSCGAMVTNCVLAETDVILGSAFKRETSV